MKLSSITYNISFVNFVGQIHQHFLPLKPLVQVGKKYQ